MRNGKPYIYYFKDEETRDAFKSASVILYNKKMSQMFDELVCNTNKLVDNLNNQAQK